MPILEECFLLPTSCRCSINRAMLGGGSMDITLTPSSPALSPKLQYHQWHSRLLSFSWVFFLLPLWSLQSQAPVWTCGPNLLSGDQEDVDHEEPLPTYEIQAVILASVDLSCGPGESHNCPFFHYYSWLEISQFTFTIFSRQLHHPAFQENPPPTFKGKSLKLLYELMVGTSRAGSSGGRGLAWIASVMYWRCWFGCTTMFLHQENDLWS